MTPSPCLHKRANHQHGVYATYKLDNCRCDPCRAANHDYYHRLTRQVAYGRWRPYEAADHARAHCLMLMRQGLGLKRIAALSGVSVSSLGKLVYGSQGKPASRRVRPETDRRILSVTADLGNIGDPVSVSALGTHRRLQSLVAAGWSQSKLAARIGMEPGNFHGTMNRARVHAKTARAAVDLYNRLAYVPPPENTHREKIAASRARNYARARGWQPPMWWDDDDLDDPEFEVVA